MALPKEPRQKMINIMYLVLTAILALNVSAEILEAFKTVDTSLQSSSANISTANSTLYESLEKKKNDAQYKEQAAIWHPKAEQARILSADLTKYIDELKLNLKKAAGLKEDGSFKEDNLDASTRLFETNKKGPELKAKLDEYKISESEVLVYSDKIKEASRIADFELKQLLEKSDKKMIIDDDENDAFHGKEKKDKKIKKNNFHKNQNSKRRS